MPQALATDTLSQNVSSSCHSPSPDAPRSGSHPVVKPAPVHVGPSLHETLLLHPRVDASTSLDPFDDDQSPTVVKTLSRHERAFLAAKPVQPVHSAEAVAATLCMYPSRAQSPMMPPQPDRGAPVMRPPTPARPEPVVMPNLPAFLRDPTAIAQPPVQTAGSLAAATVEAPDPDRPVVVACAIIAMLASAATVVLFAVRFA